MKEKILKYRMNHSLSQAAFAKLCGISPVTVLRLEHGGKPSTVVEGKIRKVIDK